MAVKDTLLAVSGLLGGPDGGEGGGGLPAGLSVMKTGTYTPAAEVGAHIFTHDLGVIPKVFVLYLENSPWRAPYNDHFLYATMVTTSSAGTVMTNVREHTTNNTTLAGGLNTTTEVNDTTIKINRANASYGGFKPVLYTNADKTESEPSVYRWYAFA